MRENTASRSSTSASIASASMPNAIGAEPKACGRTSLRLAIVVWNRPGIGRPSSMWNVPPSDSTLLKFTLPPEMWLHGIQSSACAISSGSSGGSSIAAARGDLRRHLPWLCGVGLGMPVEPEVKRYLPTESGPASPSPCRPPMSRGVSASFAKASEPSEPSAEMTATPREVERGQRLAERVHRLHEDRLRLHRVEAVLQLGEVGRHGRIGQRDRRRRRADALGREATSARARSSFPKGSAAAHPARARDRAAPAPASASSLRLRHR